MKWGDISLGTDPTTGWEMLVSYARLENQPMAPVRSVESHKFPVEIYKVFKSHRPMHMNPDSPLYLAVKCRYKPSNQVWYMRRAQAVNKIGIKSNYYPQQPAIDKYLKEPWNFLNSLLILALISSNLQFFSQASHTKYESQSRVINKQLTQYQNCLRHEGL